MSDNSVGRLVHVLVPDRFPSSESTHRHFVEVVRQSLEGLPDQIIEERGLRVTSAEATAALTHVEDWPTLRARVEEIVSTPHHHIMVDHAGVRTPEQ